MLKPPIPANEEQRLVELDRLQILYTEPEEEFDRVTAELARIFDVPLAELTFIDRDLQFVKSMAASEMVPKEVADTRIIPREMSLCSHVVGKDQTLVINDLSLDPRFADGEIAKKGVRFYSGTPLRSGGHAVGTLCLIDAKPRELTVREQKLLEMIAEGVIKQTRLRLATRDLVQRTRLIAQDLAHARDVQRFLLPPAELTGAAYIFTHAYRPMEQIGGDFLDVKQHDDGSVTLLLADVSGHGASAALTSAMTKTAFVRCAATDCSPPQLLTNLNQSLAPTTEPGRFMTALAVTYDPVTRAATLSSAGHPPPLLIRDGEIISAAMSTELPLLIEEQTRYVQSSTLPMLPGERLLMFTDGAVEARNPDGKMLEAQGLARLAADVRTFQGQQFLEQLFNRINDYAGHRLNDDVAMVCLEVR